MLRLKRANRLPAPSAHPTHPTHRFLTPGVMETGAAVAWAGVK